LLLNKKHNSDYSSNLSVQEVSIAENHDSPDK